MLRKKFTQRFLPMLTRFQPHFEAGVSRTPWRKSSRRAPVACPSLLLSFFSSDRLCTCKAKSFGFLASYVFDAPIKLQGLISPGVFAHLVVALVFKTSGGFEQ